MDKKLNVCLLNDSFPPLIDGVSNAVVNYATIINRDYGKAVVVTPDYPQKDDSKFPFNVERYSSIDTTKLVGYRAGNFLDTKTLSRLYDYKFDIIHSHCPVASTYVSRALRQGINKPIILTYHTKFDIDINNAIRSKLIRFSAVQLLVSNITACDDVWCVSRGAGENLRSLGYTGSYTVMNNGVDFEKGISSKEDIETVRKKYGIRHDVPVYLFVGRLMWYKGIRIILDALRILKNHDQDFQMIFVGGGGDQDSIIDYVNELDLSDKVSFTGPIRDRGELKAVYSACDLFLFPSTFDTNGLVVREAAASGIASVLVKGSCAAEEVTENENALLIDENSDSLASVLMNPSNNVDYYHRLGINAMDQLYCSWEQAVDKAYQRYLFIADRYANMPHFAEQPQLFDGLLDALSNIATGVNISEKMRRKVEETFTSTSQRINDMIVKSASATSEVFNSIVDTNKENFKRFISRNQDPQDTDED